ncbi:hypothetical protein FUT83_11375 [Treponema phagedenis]|nr:hypothetical protein FUT83_11375 [Treponema phagedenis]QEK09995.1 hypothetical protein FUT81_11505 [Treponema phagedenis]
MAVLSFCRPWQKLNLRVLKLCKLLCFKTSLLLGTTTIRGGSEFCRPWQNYALRVLKALESGCAFKTSLLRGSTGVRARSEICIPLVQGLRGAGSWRSISKKSPAQQQLQTGRLRAAEALNATHSL